MSVSLIIHTEDKFKLENIFNYIKRNINFSELNLLLNSKNYEPWADNQIYETITSFSGYYAFTTDDEIIDSVIDLIMISHTDEIIIADEETCTLFRFRTEEILRLNLDTNYKSIKWFLGDILTQRNIDTYVIKDHSNDCERYFRKIKSPFFGKRIIYIDGGIGDHVMAMPLIEKLSETTEVYVCCKYPFVIEHIPISGFIDWYDELFGAYKRFVYKIGSNRNSATIIDAFFEMYGEKRTESDKLVYRGPREIVDLPTDKKIALICTSAAKIEDKDSNKDWRDIRWFKLNHELNEMGYFIIQVGSKKDNQIPNVHLKFLDQPLSKLTYLIEKSDLWISVDTFFHHFASAINPNVGICLTPFYNDHAKHVGVTYIEKDCGKNYHDRRWWLDLQQPERKECMDLITVEDVIKKIKNK
jgi:hypothetical protein